MELHREILRGKIMLTTDYNHTIMMASTGFMRAGLPAVFVIVQVWQNTQVYAV